MDTPQTITKTKTRTKAIIGWALVGGAIVAAGAMSSTTIKKAVKKATSSSTTQQAAQSVLSDLTVKSVTIDPSTRLPTIIIKNQGNGPAQGEQGNFSVHVNWRNTDGAILQQGLFETIATGASPLAPNEERTIDFNTSNWGSPLEPVLTIVTVDNPSSIRPNGEVIESNETNNVWEEPALPDLVVNSITINPPSNQLPGNASITAEIKNIGFKNTGGMSTTTNIKLDLQNDGVWNLDSFKLVNPLQTNQVQSVLEPGPISIPAGTHTVRICADTDPSVNVVESNEANNCKEIAVEVVGGHPDRAVTNPVIASYATQTLPGVVGTAMSFQITVQNVGLGASGQFNTTLKFDLDNDDPADATDLALTPKSTSSLSPGGSAAYNWPWTPPAGYAGQHEAKFCAQLYQSSSGQYEPTENNCISTVFDVVGPPNSPDLTVESIYTDPPVVGAGSTPIFKAVVKNLGQSVASNPRTSWKIDVNNDGSWDYNTGGYLAYSSTSDGTKVPGPIPAGGMSIAETGGQWTAIQGTHKVRLCVDGLTEIDETNETNNCLEQVFTVSSAADLLVESITIAPQNPTPTTAPITFTAVVKNQGGVPSGNFLVRRRIDLDNNGTFDLTPSIASTNPQPLSVAANSTVSLAYHKSSVPAGNHRIEICADNPDYNNVLESNENNNCAEKIFTVAP